MGKGTDSGGGQGLGARTQKEGGNQKPAADAPFSPVQVIRPPRRGPQAPNVVKKTGGSLSGKRGKNR